MPRRPSQREQTERWKSHPLCSALSLCRGGFSRHVSKISCVAFLLNEPERLKSESFSKVRVPLVVISEAMDKEERARFLVSLSKCNSGHVHGADRLEGILLESIGFAGEVDTVDQRETSGFPLSAKCDCPSSRNR